MPAFILWIVGILLKPVVFRVLAILGIGIITYTGADSLINLLGDQIAQQFTGLPPQLAQVFGILNVDKFATIIISAYAIRLGYQATTGAFKRL